MPELITSATGSVSGELRGCSQSEVDRLTTAAGLDALPASWISYLETMGGDGSAFHGSEFNGQRTDVLGVTGTVPCRLDNFSLLLEEQESLNASPDLVALHGASLVACGNVMDHGGSSLALVSGVDDPPVVLVEGSTTRRSFRLVSMRLSAWFEGWVLPEELGLWNDEVPATSGQMRLVADRTLQQSMTRGAIEIFDELLDACMSVRLPVRGEPVTHGTHDRSWVVGEDFSWFRGTEIPSLGPGHLRSRKGGSLRLILMVALAEILGGHIVDELGLFGAGPGEVLGAEDASATLRQMRVDGDLEDFCLNFRDTIAVDAFRLLRGN